MQQNCDVKSEGIVKAVINYTNGREEVIEFKNNLLNTGREALAASLANQIEGNFDFYISRMIFGDGGTNSSSPKYVNTNRNGLFGVTRVNKPVIATIDPTIPSIVSFVSVIGFEEGNGYALNEMALQMNSGDLYSMATFADINKTSSMQITWTWQINFL